MTVCFRKTSNNAVATGAFLLTLALCAPAFAETKAEIMGPFQIEPAAGEIPADSVQPATPLQEPPEADYKILESKGTLQAERDGSLGSNLWRGARRSALVSLIPEIPGGDKSRTMLELKRRMLLTSADASQIKNDISLEPGHDLLTMRLRKLADLGLYKEGFEFYSALDIEPYNSQLAQALVTALLFAGENSLACLEAQTAAAFYGGEQEWKEILAYCDAALAAQPAPEAIAALKESDKKILQSIAENENYRFPYTPESFEALSRFEQAVLAGRQRLDLSGIENIPLDQIINRHLQLLLVHDSLNESARFRLTAEAVARGLLPVSFLQDLYTAGTKPAAGDAAPSSADLKGREKLFALYGSAQNAEGDEALWGVLEQVFAMRQEFGAAAMTPFASFIEQAPPQNPSFEDIRSAFYIMQAADGALPASWVEALEKLAPSEESSIKPESYYSLYIPVFISQPDFQRSQAGRERIAAFLETQESANPGYFALVNIIIENLDKPLEHNDNAAGIYEKDYGLTFKDDYVMPSMTVWDRLKEASQNKNLSETILLSALALRGSHPRDVYPALLRDVLSGLETVGLTEFSRKLAIEALSENEKEKL